MIPASNNMKNTEWAVAIFKDFAIRSVDLQGRFQFGGNDEINSLMETFPYMYVQANDIRVSPNLDGKSGYSSMETTFEVTIADKLLSSKDNEIQTVSDSQEIMLAVIAELSTHPYYVANQMKLIGDVLVSTTYEADDAIVSKVTAEITLRYPFKYQYCNQPVDNIPFYPTITTDIFGSVTQSICTLIEGCPVILTIENTLVDLQDQIDNIITTGGATGPTGPAGPQGETGPQGFQGPSGIDGFLGGTGPQGFTGPQGDLGPQGSTGASGTSTSLFPYKAKTTITSGDPTATHIIWNNATQISATQINISHLEFGNEDIDLVLSQISVGNILILQDFNNSNNFQKWQVSATITNIPNLYVEVPVTLITSAGSGTTGFSNNEKILLAIISQGTAGPQGFMGNQGSTGPQGATGPIQSIPLNEIAFGTGTGLTSSPLFQVIPSSGTNTISAGSLRSAVIGGDGNNMDSYNSSIIGGYTNNLCCSSENSTIIGGNYNLLHYYAIRSSIIGGANNDLYQSNDSGIIGGSTNCIKSSGNSGLIGGYRNCVVQTNNSSIIGGQKNILCNSPYSNIIGGCENLMNLSNHSSIIGGLGLTLSNEDGVVYVPQLKIATASNVESSRILVWDTDNYVKYRSASTLGIVVYKSATDGINITGTTSNSVTYTELIPASTMTTGSLIRVNYRVRTTINAATTIRVYVNTTAGLSGSPVLVGQFNNTGAPSFLVNSLLRTLVVKNASNNTEVYLSGGLVSTDLGLYNSVSTLNINWAVDQYFVFAVQNPSSTTQQARGSYYLIEKI